MSSQNKLNKAIKRAKQRDKKRQTKMKVSGKSVFTVEKLLNKPKNKH